MQFQQNQKVLINGGSITITGGNITVGSITNPVVVANDVVIVIPTFFGGVSPVNTTTTGPPQTCSGMKLLLATNIGNVVQCIVTNMSTLDSYTTTVKALSANNFPVFIPLAADANDGIRLQLNLISGISTINYQLIGLSQSPDIATPPGQPITEYPVGGLSQVSNTVTNTTGVLLSPPPSGMCYRLHRLVYVFGAGGVTGFLKGHSSSFPYSLSQPGTAAFVNPDNLNGQIAAEALDIQGIGAAGSVQLNLTYDLIAIPVIQ